MIHPDQALVNDWRQFVLSGFRQDHLTEQLYRFLDEKLNPEQWHYEDQTSFWLTWFHNLYNLYTFLTELYETEALDSTHRAFQQVLDPYYDDIKTALDDYELEIYREIRDDEVEANLAEACRMHPDKPVDLVRDELIEYFDQCMPEWFYSDYYCELDLPNNFHETLRQQMTSNLDLAHQPSVFTLHYWLDTWQIDTRAEVATETVAQTDLFSQVFEDTVEVEADYPVETSPIDPSVEDEVDIQFDLDAIKRRLAASPEEEAAMRVDPRVRNFQTASLVAECAE